MTLSNSLCYDDLSKNRKMVFNVFDILNSFCKRKILYDFSIQMHFLIEGGVKNKDKLH